MKYWFICFLWRRIGSNDWRPFNKVFNGNHALDYITKLREADTKEQESHVMVSYQEISEEIYLKWKDDF